MNNIVFFTQLCILYKFKYNDKVSELCYELVCIFIYKELLYISTSKKLMFKLRTSLHSSLYTITRIIFTKDTMYFNSFLIVFNHSCY